MARVTTIAVIGEYRFPGLLRYAQRDWHMEEPNRRQLPRYPVAASAGVFGARLYGRGILFGATKQIVLERGRLRRQDLEGSPLMCRGRSSQATSYGDQG
jgi:hypothetical protein